MRERTEAEILVDLEFSERFPERHCPRCDHDSTMMIFFANGREYFRCMRCLAVFEEKLQGVDGEK
jgi:transposase-like protein